MIPIPSGVRVRLAVGLIDGDGDESRRGLWQSTSPSWAVSLSRCRQVIRLLPSLLARWALTLCPVTAVSCPIRFMGYRTIGMTHHRWCRSTTTAVAGTVARTVTAVTTGVVTLAMAIPVVNSAALGADRRAH
jgi:hypothetical protein